MHNSCSLAAPRLRYARDSRRCRHVPRLRLSYVTKTFRVHQQLRTAGEAEERSADGALAEREITTE